MKTTFFRSFLVASLLSILAVGCGKDGASSGSSNSLTANNLLTGTSATYFNEIGKWYSGAEPTTIRNYGIVSTPIMTSSSTSSCPGEIKKILGIFEVCIVSGSGSTTGSGTVNYFHAAASTDVNRPLYCQLQAPNYSTCVSQLTYGGKAANTKLQAALNNTQGLYLMGVTKLSTTLYQLAYSNSQLETTPVVIYKIDTSLHSMYNPVEIDDLRTSTQEYLTWIN